MKISLIGPPGTGKGTFAAEIAKKHEIPMVKKFVTDDGSTTLYSEKYQEYFHTKSGALEESFEKFVKPCNLKQGAKILDICFGLGYNSLAAIHNVKKIKIIALEKDKEVLKEIQSLEVPKHLKEHFEIIKKAAEKFYYKDENVEIKIILDDATKTVKVLNENFDAVFLDPFSPSKNPELWTAIFFKNVKRVMKKGSVLSTYSYARQVRDNLSKAGFLVKDGPIIGRRSPSTLATNP